MAESPPHEVVATHDQVSWEVELAVRSPETISRQNFTHLGHHPQIFRETKAVNGDDRTVDDWVVRRVDDDRSVAKPSFGDSEQLQRLRAITPKFLTCMTGVQLGLFIVACFAQGGFAPLTVNPCIGMAY